MFDTTVFNHILRDQIDVASLPHQSPIVITHIQRDELKATSNAIVRHKLLDVFNSIEKESVSTESATWNVSAWGKAKWGKGDDLLKQMRSKLNACNKGKSNNNRDVLIAKTAIRNNYTLVTDDRHLTKVTRQFGGQVMSLHEFQRGTNAF